MKHSNQASKEPEMQCPQCRSEMEFINFKLGRMIFDCLTCGETITLKTTDPRATLGFKKDRKRLLKGGKK